MHKQRNIKLKSPISVMSDIRRWGENLDSINHCVVYYCYKRANRLRMMLKTIWSRYTQQQSDRYAVQQFLADVFLDRTALSKQTSRAGSTSYLFKRWVAILTCGAKRPIMHLPRAHHPIVILVEGVCLFCSTIVRKLLASWLTHTKHNKYFFLCFS